MTVPIRGLRALIEPGSIAIVGASERPSPGRSLVASLLRFGYEGAIYPVNPKYATISRLACYPSILEVPTPPDVVALCIGPAQILEIFPLLAERGARAAVIYAGGFAEQGEDGRKLQDTIAGLCRDGGIALCGPNAMGILNPVARSMTYLSELRDPARLAGNVGLISHSGSVCNGMLADLRRFGFSLVASTGNEAVTTTADYLEYLIDDDATRVIATFTETIRAPERYVAALDRAAAKGKPVVVLKVGRNERSRRAIQSHTGGLAGEARVFSELLRAHRAIEVHELDELTEVLAACQGARWPRGRRIGVTSGSGGQSELILDLVAPLGLELPPLPEADRREAERVIGPLSGDGNPLDYWGNGDFRTNLPHALATLGRSASHDAIVYCLDSHDDQPLALPDRLLEYVRFLAEAASLNDKPHYLMNTRPGVMNRSQVELLRRHGIPVIGGIRQGLSAIDRLARFGCPLPPPRTARPLPAQRLEALRPTGAGNGTINEFQAKRLLAACGVPAPREHLAATMMDALRAASDIGYPIVLKAIAERIPHKSNLGLVALALRSENELSAAWDCLNRRVDALGLRPDLAGFLVQEFVSDGVEFFAGISRDADFGLTLAVGSGGTDIELVRDFALRLLPLREGDAEAMIAETRLAARLAERPGGPAPDLAALADCLYALDDFVRAAGTRIVELDLNPIKVRPAGQGCVAVDALIVTKPSAGETGP